MNLPHEFAWLSNEPGPRILLEMLKLYGVHETPGPGSNPTIVGWARSIGLGNVYKNDATAWCGLTVAYAARQAGWDDPVNPLWARNWLQWGKTSIVPMLGDVLVFERGPSSGHVGLYVGQNDAAHEYWVLGGNQSDQVMIKPISKSRLLGARRCPWRVNQPANVRVVRLSLSGALSTNEA